VRCGSCGRPVNRSRRSRGTWGINDGILANWVKKDRAACGEAAAGQLSEDERAELTRLRRENAELAMERDVLKRSVVLWVKEATSR
jgi:transposase